MRQIAWIGVGVMGASMAGHLVKNGYSVSAYSRRMEKLLPLAKEYGLTPCETVSGAVSGADAVFVMVGYPKDVEEVFLGKSGILENVRPGTLVIDMTTSSPALAKRLYAEGKRRGIRVMDAPVSGGPAQSAAGQLSIMASGRPEAFARAETGLKAVASVVHRLGDEAGKGSAMKVVNQLLAGTHIAVAAEAMALGLRMGLAAEDIYAVITSAAANSWMFETRMKHVLSGDYTPLSAVDIFVKDLGIVSETTREQAMPAPLAAAALQQFVAAQARGLGREADAAVIKTFPGIELPSKE